ncbi:transcriptional regulator, partial [Salmonella enterica subsp. enterica serovar Montevideo]|nr:transcriptional regulator [Salmonella enterica subsp. enterica serovar Montevideo]
VSGRQHTHDAPRASGRAQDAIDVKLRA